MPGPPYRVLRVALGFLSLLMAIEGVLLLVSTKQVIERVFLYPPQIEISKLLLASLKEVSGLVLMLAVLLFLASRDPERNVAIIDALAVGLCIAAITPLVSFYTLDLGKLYPAYGAWGRAIVRLVLAAWIYYLRPREAYWKPAGNF
jgi:uncharacterized BrkB/YihY/UPF0761 family membrane protein